jgi:hypothetical protein
MITLLLFISFVLCVCLLTLAKNVCLFYSENKTVAVGAGKRSSPTVPKTTEYSSEGSLPIL